MRKLLATATLFVLALVAAPAAAQAAQVQVSGGQTGYAPTPTTGTGPQAGEIALGSFVAPAATRTPARHGAATGLKTNPTCAVQCITSGVAYGRGPDARLVVTTDTPATIRIVLSGPAGYTRQFTSVAGSTYFVADADDLTADTTYEGVVIATDPWGNTALRHGTFTTLQRNVDVVFSEAHIGSTPYASSKPFSAEIWFEGDAVSYEYAGSASGGVLPLGINLLGDDDTDRFLELAVELRQFEQDDDDICEVSGQTEPELDWGYGDCDYAAYAQLPGGSLDLDDRPWNTGTWNDYAYDAELVIDTPYYSPLTFTVPVGVHVTFTP